MLTLSPSRRRARGFTLIELLVVIAIIAILAAILFPVFFSVREKARQGTVLDHYRQINDALAKYKQDHHQYPPVLFGYAYPGANMSGAKAAAAQANVQARYFPGLYPEYINDPAVFTDPNNTVGTDSAQTDTVMVNALNATGALTQTSQTFYAADAFDANPVIDATGAPTTTYAARYQRVWTNMSPTASPRQLVVPNSPANTFITCTTYHAGSGIGQGKVLALFQGGNTAVMDDSKFLGAAGGSDGPNATFWQVTP